LVGGISTKKKNAELMVVFTTAFFGIRSIHVLENLGFRNEVDLIIYVISMVLVVISLIVYYYVRDSSE